MAEKDIVVVGGSAMTYNLLDLIAVDNLHGTAYSGVGTPSEYVDRRDDPDDHWCSGCDKDNSAEWVGDDGVARCVRCAVRVGGPWL